jgi:hypothetical protein
LISEQRSSGKTQKDWCAEHGIRLRTFRDWVYRSNPCKFKSAGTVNWIELDTGNVSSEKSMFTAIEVSAGLYTVSVKPGFDHVMFSDICRILAELC